MITNQTDKLWADAKTVQRIYGISNTPLFNLRKRGAVRSISLRAEGDKYGKRLFYLPSIEAFLCECEQRQKGGSAQ